LNAGGRCANVFLKLTRFRGHLILMEEGVRYAQDPPSVPGGISPADDRAGCSRQHACTVGATVRLHGTDHLELVGHAAVDRGKPSTSKEGLTNAEREELHRLRRQVRQLQTERDILAKATAWFAARGEKTFTPSSSS
jgi:transposase-like protein